MKHSLIIRLAACLLLGVLLSALCFSLSSCEIQPGEMETTVFIATDVHLFSDNLLSEDNQRYTKDKFVSDGRIQEYDYQLMEALVEQVNAQIPEYLILTGDLTFNGERDSHLEVARLLSGVNPDTKVLVIPGNHDVYSINAVSVINDKMEAVDSITSEDFREIYADFGYEGAVSYDADSLSYIYALDDDKWALMLDTSLSRYNEEYDYQIVGGGIEESTLAWLEEKLIYAKENGIDVISFSHHNLLVHNQLFEYNYTMRNSGEVLALFAEYEVKLNFSGHLHIQSIKNTQVDGTTIYDVSGGSLLDYGNRYGRLDIYDNCYSYESKPLPVSEKIREHSFEVFATKYYYKTFLTYKTSLGAEDAERATRVLSEINAYYFDGSYEQIRSLVWKNRALIGLIERNTKDYDSSYVSSIINVERENQHSILIER